MTVTVVCRDGVSVVALCDGTEPPPGRPAHARPHVHCFLIRTRERLVLVDTGLGPARPGRSGGHGGHGPVPGADLPGQLAAAGVGPEDVTDVVLTHLHPGHVGWNVAPDGLGTPLFRNARHVVQERELADPGTAAYHDLYRTKVRPLLDHGLLTPINGHHTLLPHVELLPSPGHTAGHQCVLVAGDERSVLLTGDAVPAEPPTGPACTVADDPEEARRTSDRLATLAHGQGCVVAPAHLGAPFVRLGGNGASGSGGLEVVAPCEPGSAAPVRTA